MSVSSYEKNGQRLWKVYVNIRSQKNPVIREQKVVPDLPSEEKALAEEKRLIRELSQKVIRLEAQGAPWDVVIDKWVFDKKSQSNGEYVATTITDHSALLRNWTKDWLLRPASQLNRGDGRQILRAAEAHGKKPNFLRKLKNTINVVYTWGIEEGLITGVELSPVHGLEVGKEKEDKLPEILTREEIRLLLVKGKELEHEWYPVWCMAVLTGMRSGELHALRWTSLELATEDEARRQESLPVEKRRYGLIRVTQTWNTRERDFGPTKGGYWRTVPVSGELFWFLADLKKRTGNQEFVLPRFWEWDKGEQARILRTFCLGMGLKSIKFHTLRACFATQLISEGVAATRVMKVGGWKDIKTMQRYIRMAGVDEQGVTEALHFLPSETAIMDHVVNLYDFRARKGDR